MTDSLKIASPAAATPIVEFTIESFTLGGDYASPPLLGIIDHLAKTKRTLTPTEIQSLRQFLAQNWP